MIVGREAVAELITKRIGRHTTGAAVRSWEAKGLIQLRTPGPGPKGSLYTPAEVIRCAAIATLRMANYSIEEIKIAFGDESK